MCFFFFFFLLIRCTPRFTLTYTLVPCTTRFRSDVDLADQTVVGAAKDFEIGQRSLPSSWLDLGAAAVRRWSEDNRPASGVDKVSCGPIIMVLVRRGTDRKRTRLNSSH